MVGLSEGFSERLRREILADTKAAASFALTRPVAAVSEALSYDFVDSHAEACERFFLAWIDALPVIEGLAAAREVSGRYVHEMVWLPRAYDKSIGVEIRALARVLTLVADEQDAYRVFSDSPDSTISLRMVERYEEIARQFRAIAAQAGADGRELMG